MHEHVLDETAAAAPARISPVGLDKRSAPRFTLLIRAAKLICARGEFLCIVRDVSETGVSIRLFHPLPPADTIVLEMPNGDRHPVETIWLEDDRGGFRFAVPVDLVRLVENPSRFARRAMRVNISLEASVVAAGQVFGAMVHNISQQGAQITVAERLAIQQRLQLKGGGLPEIEAKVQWRRENTYGLVFENTFQLADLAQIVARIQLGREG